MRAMHDDAAADNVNAALSLQLPPSPPRITCVPLTASVADGILDSSLKLARTVDVSNRHTELKSS